MTTPTANVGKTHIMQGALLQGPGFPFSPEQLAIIKEVGAFAREHFAPIAERWDRENRFPRENFEILHKKGWLGIPVSRQNGGLGMGIHHDPLAWVGVIEELSRACGNTGQTFQIWGHCVAMFEELGNVDQVKRFDESCLAGDIWCSGGSEPGSYTQSRQRASLGTGTSLRPVDGGYLLNGRKLFISNSSAADMFFIFADLVNPDGSSAGLVHPVLRKGTPGLSVELDWDAMGMRGTATDSLVFDNVFVPKEDVIALDDPNAYYRCVLAGSFLTGRSAVYLGIAESALDFTADYVRNRIKATDDPVMQYRMGDLEVTRSAAWSMLYRSAWLWQEVVAGRLPAQQAASFTTMTHVFVESASLRITSECLELGGGGASLRSAPLERYHRDVRAYTVSPPTVNTALVNVGSQLLRSSVPRESIVKEGV